MSALALKDFSVYEKDDESAINVIAKLAKKGAVATLTLTNALEEDTDYILDVDGVGQAEFTYEEAEAASIAFVATTVKTGADVLYVIKDAAGNDITANYSLADLTVQTSASSVVSTALKAGSTAGNAIVNVIITDTEIETGNTIIKVQDSLQVLTSIGKWTLVDSGTLDKPVTELFKKDDEEAIEAEALDQFGETIDSGIVFSFVSKDAGVLVVDATTGDVTPIAVGTANVVITAKQGTTKTVSKTVQIKVKADPVATTLNVTPASVQMALGTTVEASVKVEVLDQYGEPFGEGTSVTAKTSKAGLAYNASTTDLDAGKTFALDADGEATIALLPDTATATSGKLTVTYGTLTKKEVTVSIVAAGDFAGYVVETPDGLILDLNADDEDLAEGPASSEVEVYEIDTKGNKIQAASFTLERVDLEGKAEDKQPVTVSGADVSAQAVGTQSVRVKVGDTVQKTLSFTVVDTTPVLDNVKLVKSAVSVLTTESDLLKVLFGTGDDGKGALVGYDQYGEKIAVATADYTLTSSDTTVVANNGNVSYSGTAKLTIVFADLEQIHFVNVVVTAP